jgi:hypothetical protein
MDATPIILKSPKKPPQAAINFLTFNQAAQLYPLRRKKTSRLSKLPRRSTTSLEPCKPRKPDKESHYTKNLPSILKTNPMPYRATCFKEPTMRYPIAKEVIYTGHCKPPQGALVLRPVLPEYSLYEKRPQHPSTSIAPTPSLSLSINGE